MSNTKEVYFDEYCKTCEFEENSATKEPCDTCLGNPYNIDSHKPTEWKAKSNVN